MTGILTLDFSKATSLGMLAVLAILAGLLAFGFWTAQRSNNDFDILDLVMEDGKLSRVSCVLMGSFAVTTWMMVNLTLTGRMTETYFSAYGAMWVAPLIVRLIKGKDAPAVPPAGGQ